MDRSKGLEPVLLCAARQLECHAMKASEAVKQIQDAVLEVEKTGAKELLIANLNAYLANVSATALQQEQGEPSITEAQANHQLEVWKAELSRSSTMSVEMLKATVEAGQTALRSAIVINGGAAATVLAFAGNAIAKGLLVAGAPLLTQIGTALLWFMVGAGIAGVASGFRYLSQYAYGSTHWGKTSVWWVRCGAMANVISIGLAIGSFAAFFVGGLAAYHAVVVPS